MVITCQKVKKQYENSAGCLRTIWLLRVGGSISIFSIPKPVSFRYFKTSPEIIQLAVIPFRVCPLCIGTAFRTTPMFSESSNQLYLNDILERYGCAPRQNFSIQYQWLNCCMLTLCVCDLKIHHAFFCYSRSICSSNHSMNVRLAGVY